LERKLTGILCADVYSYSRLMGDDEEATFRTLASHRKIIDVLIEQHHGHFVSSAGDSLLAFPGIIPWRLDLIICYVQLGMMDHAREQAAEVMRQRPQFSLESGFFKPAQPSYPSIADLRKAELK
jgi:class 3 adenylate cyclase